ncbi:glycosyltransferase family 31 [Diaporthe amygdali]|uniref:glycosyltransferase family 31 n=1 Tax=Phomopsis amygdali TaxID=1214568 RepID=UPI0022FEFB5A|nr:glycosyltransferase family 31 [Diaporthe amygdali]KAJ0107894.1 glycosyltransferase family 31 [Diaporthe amygdali]
MFLPYDSPILSFLRLTSSKAFGTLRPPDADERLLLELPGQFPFTDEEVAYIVKTGYGTQERVPALLEASGALKAGSEYGDNILVVGDFATTLQLKGRTVLVHDVVAAAIEHEAVVKTQLQGTERIQKYRDMTSAIQQGRKEDAEQSSKAVGWELDALKFIPSLELAWKSMPGKKWYIMQDDDTFIIRPSLYRFLEHLDASNGMYLGNAIGDYKTRFAHGGSSFILSHETMRILFDDNPEVVSEAYVASLDETWGDKLIATTLNKIGVYISERYGHFFNGERPLITKVSADRFCSPVVSFHGLAEPAQMKDVGKTFAKIEQPVFWKDLWEIYGQPDLDVLNKNPIRPGQDHVGRQDDVSMISRTSSVDRCLGACERRPKKCLAWSWDKNTELCIMSPWVIVGEEKPEERLSGLNVGQVRKLVNQCGKY